MVFRPRFTLEEQAVQGNIFTTNATKIVFDPDYLYVDSDSAINQLMGAGLHISTFDEMGAYLPTGHTAALLNPGQAVNVWVDQGIGDCVAMEPALRELVAQGHPVTIYMRPPRESLFKYAPWYKAIPLPVKLDDIDKEAVNVNIAGVPMNWHDHHMPMSHIFAELLGVRLPDDKRCPQIIISEKERKCWDTYFEDLPTPIIGVQIATAIERRSYPPQLLAELMEPLTELGTVLLIGTKSQYQAVVVPYLHYYPDHGWVSACGTIPTPLHLAGLVSRCDVLITPDTGILHIAGALNPPVPTIGLTAIYPPEYAAGTHPCYFPVSSTMKCSPCCDHRHSVTLEKCKGEDGIINCWHGVNADTIVYQVERALEYGKTEKRV